MTKIDVIAVRTDLHNIPELGMKEYKTSAYLADALEGLGYDVQRSVGGTTGVVGTIRGTEPGPVLMLRADMDALPFKNADGSVQAVHACGHDGHSAMLLACAAELVGRVKKGTLKIVFQPGEETLEGAVSMIRAGVLDDVDIALGMHVRPVQDIAAGTVCAAVCHTSSGFVDIEVKGRGAHASRPHLGINCAEAAALITQAICAIKLDPTKIWSCKVTSLVATAAATNIIPDTATIKIDVRAQTNEIMKEMLDKIECAAKSGAACFGATATLSFPGPIIPAAVYDEGLMEELAQVITQELGADKLAANCGGGGEDFHFYKNKKPSLRAAYFGVGAGCTPGLHDRNMTFDPQYLSNGVKVMTAMALRHIG